MKSLKAKFRKSDTNEWNKNDERLLQAVENGDSERVASLLGKKGVGATKLDGEGKTAFHLAATKGYAEGLRIMVTHGLDITAPDATGHSALHLAAKNGHTECVKRLLQFKCPADCTDGIGKTALHHAAASGCLPVVQLLCEHKCPLNVKDTDGTTPLLIAVQSDNLEVCRYLLDQNADVNSRDKNGRTALMLACETSNFNIVDLCIRKGADLKSVDALGHSVLHYSKLSKNEEIHNLLLSKISPDADTKTPTKLKQHDQVIKLSSERSGTPKKRKAPPPPISPLQISDISSPQSATSTPQSGTGEVFFPEHMQKISDISYSQSATSTPASGKGQVFFPEHIQKEENSYKREKDLMSDSTGADSLLDVSSEVDQQDVLSLLQAKIASLTLHNKELQCKLQEKASNNSEMDINKDSHQLPEAVFDQLVEKQSEAKTPDTESPLVTREVSTEPQIESTSELKVKQLCEALQDLQIELERSEAERKHLEAQLKSRHSGDSSIDNEDLSEHSADLCPKVEERPSKVETPLKEILNAHDQLALVPVNVANKNQDENAWVDEQQALKEELGLLKQEQEQAEVENKGSKEQIQYLETELEKMKERLADMTSAEEREEIKNSYGLVIENINQEKLLLIEKYKEGQEEIKRLQDALKPLSDSIVEAGEVKETMTKTMQGLSKQVSELSLLYKEAQRELDHWKTQPTEDVNSNHVNKEEHDKIVLELKDMKVKAEDELVEMEAEYERALHELVALKQQLDNEKENTLLISENQKIITTLRNAVNDLEAERNELEEQLGNKELDIKNLQEHLLGEKAANHEAAVAKDSSEKLKVSLQEKMCVLSCKLQETMKEKEKVCLDSVHLKREMLQVKGEKEEIETLLKLKEQEVTELCLKYSQIQDDLVEMKKYSESSSKLEEDKDQKINELSKEVIKLKEALNSLSQLSFSTCTSKRQNQQLETLQQQVKQLQSQLSESKKQHQDIVSVYRKHLLYAVQGQMDEDVQKVLKQILSMCKSQSQKK